MSTNGAPVVARLKRMRKKAAAPPPPDPPPLPPAAVEVIPPDEDQLPANLPVEPTLDILEKVVEALRTGNPLEGVRADVERLVANQQTKTDLINNLVLAHDFDRLTLYLKARSKLERFLFGLLQQEKLSAQDALAYFRIVYEEAKVLTDRVQNGSSPVKDASSELDKVDLAVQQAQQALKDKLKDTSPQGREIIRRLRHKAQGILRSIDQKKK